MAKEMTVRKLSELIDELDDSNHALAMEFRTWRRNHTGELADPPRLTTSLPDWAIMATWIKERIEECL